MDLHVFHSCYSSVIVLVIISRGFVFHAVTLRASRRVSGEVSYGGIINHVFRAGLGRSRSRST